LKRKTTKEIEQENECPSCYDVMALSSYFEESRILRMVTLLKNIEVQISQEDSANTTFLCFTEPL
jgi:hypothetical protein